MRIQYTGKLFFICGRAQNQEKQMNKKPMNTEVGYFIIHLFLVRYSSVQKWSRGESNPCPNIATISFLHAYFLIICRHAAGREQTNNALSWMVLGNSHSLLLQRLLLL